MTFIYYYTNSRCSDNNTLYIHFCNIPIPTIVDTITTNAVDLIKVLFNP